MKIEGFTLREIRMPLVHFFETSFGRTTERRILLVTAHCEGVDGWGECTAGEHPFYSEESIDTASYVTEKFLAPALLGRDLDLSEEKAADGSVVPTLRATHGRAKITQMLSSMRKHRMVKGREQNSD